MNNWIKYHAMSMVANNNLFNRTTLLDYQQKMWERTPEVTTDEVYTEINRLFETQQLIEEDGYVKMGTPLFEEAVEVSTKAHNAALAIMKNLTGRRGVGNEIESMDDDVREEMVNSIAAIIDKNYQ